MSKFVQVTINGLIKMPRQRNHNQRDYTLFEGPLLQSIQSYLVKKLKRVASSSSDEYPSAIIGSNTLADQFILENWGIRKSQRVSYRNLFQRVRLECRSIFNRYLRLGRLEIDAETRKYAFRVYKFSENRGNLILGFVKYSRNSEWAPSAS
ncbi:MAG: hypothetical protein BAJATHORv1_50002 [Candidatus Thorarchaeota archaeon]|nr:MAG: hypothetical protein BAJATHORv1_50002 [Candidatus Thorarchaeota archaeon]